jgi:putative oxidoreductase
MLATAMIKELRQQGCKEREDVENAFATASAQTNRRQPVMTDKDTASAGLLLGRLLLATIFVHEGWDIIGSYSGTMAYMQKSGVPGALLPAVLALELGGGVLIAAGAITRFVSLAFTVFCLLTAVLFHWHFADRNQLLHFEKDLAIAGGFLLLAVSGPGHWSVDRYLRWS